MTIMEARDPVHSLGLSPCPGEDFLDEITLTIEEMDRLFEREDTGIVDLGDLDSVLDAVVESDWADHARKAITWLWDQGHRPIGIGTTRVVFGVGDHCVAKVPIEYRGVLASQREEHLSRTTGKLGEIPIADCDFDPEHLILWMERVEPVHFKDYEEAPDWVWYIDCAQVGYDADGILVAYDL